MVIDRELLQTPDGLLSKSRFDSMAGFLIPKNEVMQKLVKVNLVDMKIMSFPMGICELHLPFAG